jgi:hypothetical protein
LCFHKVHYIVFPNFNIQNKTITRYHKKPTKTIIIIVIIIILCYHCKSFKHTTCNIFLSSCPIQYNMEAHLWNYRHFNFIQNPILWIKIDSWHCFSWHFYRIIYLRRFQEMDLSRIPKTYQFLEKCPKK